MLFLVVFYGFDMLMSRIKNKSEKQFILMHFQAKSYFKKHLEKALN